VLGHLTAPQLWPALDHALSEADRGDSGSMYDMLDALQGRTPAHPDADTDGAQLAVHEHPTFGAFGKWWLFVCATWPAPRCPLPSPTSTITAPILVVGGSADPSTPLAGAQALTRVIGPSAALLTSAVPGHTSFGRSACVDERVLRLLLRLERPRLVERCA
jgi:pimeloyl-ACP methyl ester carboxylesterase